MNSFVCASCYTETDLSLLAGTIICKKCLEKAKKNYNADPIDKSLEHEVKEVVANDIYD